MIRSRTFFSLAFVMLIFTSCGKPNPETSLPIQQFFETNILNRNFVVTLAQDSSGNITSDYTGYVFVLLKTDFYHGPLKATFGSNTYMGTWSCDSDYGKLTITLPDSPVVFQFLARSWRFVKKEVPTLQLSPWGTTQPYLLNMTRQ
jgi:O-glycosyl hydrolase